MSSSPVIALQKPKKLYYSANTHSIQRALHNGRKASKELESSLRASHVDSWKITTGRQIEGVGQDFVLHGTNPATIMIPCTLANNVNKKDFFQLLETQRVEHLLVDTIASSTTSSDIANQYYSQVLMAHRLQRAQLEVDLYKLAIGRDGLILLEDSDDEEESTEKDTV